MKNVKNPHFRYHGCKIPIYATHDKISSVNCSSSRRRPSILSLVAKITILQFSIESVGKWIFFSLFVKLCCKNYCAKLVRESWKLRIDAWAETFIGDLLFSILFLFAIMRSNLILELSVWILHVLKLSISKKSNDSPILAILTLSHAFKWLKEMKLEKDESTPLFKVHSSMNLLHVHVHITLTMAIRRSLNRNSFYKMPRTLWIDFIVFSWLLLYQFW